MSDFSLTLVLQFKTSKIINDMAKVQQKSDKISAFGGIFFVLDKFDSILSSVIDSHLGLRSRLIGYQYSEIIRAVSVQIHRRTCQVGQNGKAVQTQHLLQQTIQPYLGTRIKQLTSQMIWSKPLDLMG